MTLKFSEKLQRTSKGEFPQVLMAREYNYLARQIQLRLR